MSAGKYGRRYNQRAAATATRLDASRLKNQIPGLSSSVTYVRTLSSRKLDRYGNGNSPRARSDVTAKGVTPTQALPSRSSIDNPAGTCGRKRSASTGQCAKSSSSHVWPITHDEDGNGHGRCSVSASDEPCRAGAFSSSPMSKSITRRALQISAQRLL